MCQAIVKTIKEGDFEGNKAYFVLSKVKQAVKDKLKELIEIYGSKDKAWEVKPKGLPTFEK